jgi:Na+/H+ antiporter NhaC/CRP-like cAMP-binding protein
MGEVINAAYIQTFFRFGDSPRDQKALLAVMKILIPRRYSNGDVICRHGEAADAVFFIDSGSCAVLDEEDKTVGEMQAGQSFGEYAVLSGEKRLATVAARGEVVLYELRKKYLLKLASYFPHIYGVFLKRVYDHASEDYKRLTAMINSRRGIAGREQVKGAAKKGPAGMVIGYVMTALLFAAAAFFITPELRNEPWVISAPFVFLLVYVIVSGRVLESLVLAVLLTRIILAGKNCIPAFYTGLAEALSDGETAEIILVIALMGIMVQLLTASGSVNALGTFAKRRFKTGRGVLLASLVSMILIFVDDLFAFLITGSCFRDPADSRRVPREKQAVLMGLFPAAVCVLNPLSIWGVYILGLIGAGNFLLFTGSLRFNFTALLVVLFSVLLALGFPLPGPLGRAQKRVNAGGPLWPPGSEKYETKNSETQRGKFMNLFLPLLTLAVSSVGIESFRAGTLEINFNYGLLVTLAFMFFLYCFQRYMSPEQFFGHIIHGVESMLAPILLLVMIRTFSLGMESLGFFVWFGETIRLFIGTGLWMLPGLLFVFFTLMALLFGGAWAMYIIGVPLAIQLAAVTGGNPALFLGAVCAAGIAGANLSMYVGDLFIIGSTIGIEPMTYFRAQFPYVLGITILSAAGYAAAGWLGL